MVVNNSNNHNQSGRGESRLDRLSHLSSHPHHVETAGSELSIQLAIVHRSVNLCVR